MNLKSENIPMVAIGQALRAAYGQGATHTRIYRAVVGGLVPATRETAGWTVPRSALPELARCLGIDTNPNAQA